MVSKKALFGIFFFLRKWALKLAVNMIADGISEGEPIAVVNCGSYCWGLERRYGTARSKIVPSLAISAF